MNDNNVITSSYRNLIKPLCNSTTSARLFLYLIDNARALDLNPPPLYINLDIDLLLHWGNNVKHHVWINGNINHFEILDVCVDSSYMVNKTLKNEKKVDPFIHQKNTIYFKHFGWEEYVCLVRHIGSLKLTTMASNFLHQDEDNKNWLHL